MKGQMTICQICTYQDRREDNGQETKCILPYPVMDYDSCEVFDLVGGQLLGARLAELYGQLELAWDMIIVLLAAHEAVVEEGVAAIDARRDEWKGSGRPVVSWTPDRPDQG